MSINTLIHKTQNMTFRPLSQIKIQIKRPANDSLPFNAEQTISSFSPRYLIIFNIVVRYCQAYKVVWVSQEKIAQEAGTVREVVNRACKFFEKKGLITMNYRHMRTSLYHLSPYFKLPDVRHRLKDLVPSLRSALISSIFLFSSLAYPKVTLTKNSNVYIYTKETKKRYEGMETPKLNPISPAIRNIKSLNLTKWGQITLACFPEKAIEYAEKSFKYGKSIRDPFKFFYKLCFNYCIDNDTKPDYIYRNRLASIFNMPEDPKLLLNNKPVCDKTSRVETVTKINVIEEYKKKETTERERYESSISHLKPKLKQSYEPNAQAEEFLKILGLK
jgi:hypothetical protein